MYICLCCLYRCSVVVVCIIHVVGYYWSPTPTITKSLFSSLWIVKQKSSNGACKKLKIYVLTIIVVFLASELVSFYSASWIGHGKFSKLHQNCHINFSPFPTPFNIIFIYIWECIFVYIKKSFILFYVSSSFVWCRNFLCDFFYTFFYVWNIFFLLWTVLKRNFLVFGEKFIRREISRTLPNKQIDSFSVFFYEKSFQFLFIYTGAFMFSLYVFCRFKWKIGKNNFISKENDLNVKSWKNIVFCGKILNSLNEKRIKIKFLCAYQKTR